MGNSNKKGKKDKPKKEKKGKGSGTAPEEPEEPAVEVWVEPEFNKDQYEKAKNAIVDGNIPSVLSAIEGMQVNMRDSADSNNTLLHYAALYNNVNIAKYLIEKGAKNRKNDQGQTPLELAQAACAQDSSFFEMKSTLQKVPEVQGF